MSNFSWNGDVWRTLCLLWQTQKTMCFSEGGLLSQWMDGNLKPFEDRRDEYNEENLPLPLSLLFPVSLSFPVPLPHLPSMLKTSKYVNEVLRCIYTRHRLEFYLKSVKEGDLLLTSSPSPNGRVPSKSLLSTVWPLFCFIFALLMFRYNLRFYFLSGKVKQ